MPLAWIDILIGSGALVGAVALWIRARRTRRAIYGHGRRLAARRSAVKKPAADRLDGKRCAEIAGGPLDPMADYEVSHPYWYIAVEDD